MFDNIGRTPKKVNPLLEKGEVKPKTKRIGAEAEKKQNSRRNIKIYDDAYYDLVALSQCKDMTHNELIVWLVNKAVSELDDKQKDVFEHLRAVAEEKRAK